MFVDAETWLPFASQQKEAHGRGGLLNETTIDDQYSYEFVDASSLPADYFDPASIGYVAPDTQRGLRSVSDMTPYWLGAEFDPVSPTLPKLALLGGGSVQRVAAIPGYWAVVNYRDGTHGYGDELVSMQEWPRSAWEVARTKISGLEPSPGTGDRIELTNGYAIVFPRDRYYAMAYFTDTVVFVSIADQMHLYNSANGMRAIVKGLAAYHQ